jgi:hypothetical protein
MKNNSKHLTEKLLIMKKQEYQQTELIEGIDTFSHNSFMFNKIDTNEQLYKIQYMKTSKNLIMRTTELSLIVLMFLGLFLSGITEAFAAIAIRGTVTTGQASGSNTLIINKPTGVVAGDVMIVNIMKYDGTSAITTPSLSGWTLIAGSALSGSNLRYGGILYRVADGTEGASFTFTIGSGIDYAAGAITAFSGVDVSGATPFDVSPGTISTPAGTATTLTVTSITTSTANAAVIMFGMNSNSTPRTFSTFSTTSPGTLTEIYDYLGATYERVGAGWAIKSTAGSTGTSSLTLSGSSYLGGILIALKAKVPTITGFSPTSGCQGATGIVITGTNFTGATVVNFNGVSSGFTVDNSTQITATVPLTATTGTISVTTAEGTATSAATFTANLLPSAPTSLNTAICSGNTSTLTASGAVSGDKYKWYDAVSGGNLLKTSTNNTDNTFTTPTLASTTNYWVSIISSASCEGARTQVTVTVSNTVSSVNSHTDISCYAGSNGTITIQASGGITPYQFSVDNGTTYVVGSNPYTYSGLSANVAYEIRVKDSIGCESPQIP